MIKELEALERIKSMVLFGGEISLPYYTLNDTEYAKKVIEYKKDKLDLIENALKENKALKSQIVGLENAYDKLADKCEKYYKALEIIKEKGIILQFIKETYTVEQYNAGVFGTLVKPLTQEEYDLVKEVLL